MNNGNYMGSEDELLSSQHLHLQPVSCRLLNIATVPVGAGKVQCKKSIADIRKASRRMALSN
jgi:hypothetical protein